jgi:hypothetical protein
MLLTNNQLPWLPGSAINVCVAVGSTQLLGHTNFILGSSWAVTINERMIECVGACTENGVYISGQPKISDS